MFTFAPYSILNKDDWFYLANELLISNTIALDELHLTNNSVFNIIIYSEKGLNKKIPIGIFLSSGIYTKFNGFLKVINANSGGLYITKKYRDNSWKIKKYFQKELIENYFCKIFKVDVIEFMQSTSCVIDGSREEYIANPSFRSFSLNNSILYMDLSADPIDKFIANSRYEIKKGLKHIQDNIILDKRDKTCIDYIVSLDQYKAVKLGIKPFSRDYFEGLFYSNHYNFLVCMDEKNLYPISCVIYSVTGSIAEFIYMAGINEARKYYVNKALLYMAMSKAKAVGCDYFALGVGYIEKGNMKDVTTYKRSMSSDEASCNMHRIPVSLFGQAYCALLFLINR